ncbi:unnamed protein product [Rotaria socialis]|uniref:Uncharacterized protein n=2 Tax=Rotaria socialis TaxID=392032 RepID=A0A818NQA9_9BILA|nr:unnamed protein product [Rotaria socialis]CAF3608641.1 unnamed protein product [Rotaria socialis]CAF4514354.1 unnamed protein product [Rotaria socialis]CAF4601942.1 unnamed protein product [Rotaria socialis]
MNKNIHIENTTTPETETRIEQGQTDQMKKKKCRGDRKRQRYRRQLYNQGLGSTIVEKLIQEKFPSQIQESQQQQDKIKNSQIQNIHDGDDDDDIMEMGIKRKRMLLTPTPTTEAITILDKPLSQLSISQGDPKKVKATTKTTLENTLILDESLSQLSISQENANKTVTTVEKPATKKNQVNNGIKESPMSHLENFKPRYLKVSDLVFKRILSDAIENGFKFVECLNSPEKLHIVREITEITNNLYFKDFQAKLWQEYYNISSKDNNWESKITKRFARQHNTCRMYRPQRSYIQERQATIAHQKERIGNQLQEYLTKLLNNIEQWQPSIDGTLLSHAINECVRHSQHRLKEEFEYKKEMLTLDWTDHRLLVKFYELKPNEELIQLAQNIWQVTADELKTKEQEEILQQRIYLKRLPAKTDQMINELVNDNQITLSNPFLDTDQRASFASRCSKTIIQCKFNLMIIELDEFTIVTHRYDLTLSNLKEKLFNLHKENPHIYTTLSMNIIEERRQAMIQRAVRIRQHKLKTFFDQAPAVNGN